MDRRPDQDLQLGISIAGPESTFPALTGRRHVGDVPEADPAFGNSDWLVTDHTTTNGG